MPRIVAVAVLPLNRAVLAVDDELGSLVATDKATASSFRPGTLHVPAAIWIRHYVVTVTHTGDLMRGLMLSGEVLSPVAPCDKPLDCLRPDMPRQGQVPARGGSRVSHSAAIDTAAQAANGLVGTFH